MVNSFHAFIEPIYLSDEECQERFKIKIQMIESSRYTSVSSIEHFINKISYNNLHQMMSTAFSPSL